MTSEAGECRWRATHEYDDEGFCRNCYKRAPREWFSSRAWWLSSGRAALLGPAGTELKRVAGYEPALIEKGTFLRENGVLRNDLPIVFARATASWGWIWGIRLMFATESLDAPLFSPTFIASGDVPRFERNSIRSGESR